MNNLLNKTYGKKNVKIIWFIGEIIQMITLIIGGIMLLWLYAPYTTLTKIILTIITTYITYDVFKSFVWIRWILMKENGE